MLVLVIIRRRRWKRRNWRFWHRPDPLKVSKQPFMQEQMRSIWEAAGSGARAYAQNPEGDRLLEAIDYAHLYGGKTVSDSQYSAEGQRNLKENFMII